MTPRQRAMSPRFAIALVASLVGFTISIYVLFTYGITPPPSHLEWLNVDWQWYRDGMERIIAGDPLYDPRLLSGSYNQLLPELEFTWNQAPSALVVVAPFYLLPEIIRSSVFFLFSTTCAIAAVTLVWPRAWSTRTQILLVIVLLPLLWAVIYWGNLITLAALGVAIAWTGYRRDADRLIVLGLVCAGLVKIFPAVVIGLWLLTRFRVRPVIIAAAIGAVSMLPAVLYGGPSVVVDFLASQANALTPIATTNIAPRVIAHNLGFDLPQLVMQLIGASILVFALWPGRRPETSWLLLQVAILGFISNVWVHWPFPAVVMAIAWLVTRAPRADSFEDWLDRR